MSLKEKLTSAVKNIALFGCGLSMLASCSTMPVVNPGYTSNVENKSKFIAEGTYSTPNKTLKELGYPFGDGQLCSVDGILFNYKDNNINNLIAIDLGLGGITNISKKTTPDGVETRWQYVGSYIPNANNSLEQSEETLSKILPVMDTNGDHKVNRDEASKYMTSLVSKVYDEVYTK